MSQDGIEKTSRQLRLLRAERGFVLSESLYGEREGMMSQTWAFSTVTELADWLIYQYAPVGSEEFRARIKEG